MQAKLHLKLKPEFDTEEFDMFKEVKIHEFNYDGKGNALISFQCYEQDGSPAEWVFMSSTKQRKNARYFDNTDLNNLLFCDYYYEAGTEPKDIFIEFDGLEKDRYPLTKSKN